MARDKEKYDYYLVGVPKGSQTHKALLEDADKCGTKQIPTLICIRLGDYYEMRQGGGQVVQITKPEESKEEVGYSKAALSNADAASSFWAED